MLSHNRISEWADFVRAVFSYQIASRALPHLVIQVCLEGVIYITVHSNSFILCYANACTKYCFLLSPTNRPLSKAMGNPLSLQCDFMIQVCSSALASVAPCWAEWQTHFLMQHGAAGHCVDMSRIPWMLSIISLFSAHSLAILSSQGLNLSFQKERTVCLAILKKLFIKNLGFNY